MTQKNRIDGMAKKFVSEALYSVERRNIVAEVLRHGGVDKSAWYPLFVQRVWELGSDFDTFDAHPTLSEGERWDIAHRWLPVGGVLSPMRRMHGVEVFVSKYGEVTHHMLWEGPIEDNK